MNETTAVGAPLEIPGCSAGTLLLMDQKQFFEPSLSAVPSPFRRNSAGAPLHVARKSERTTSPSERYDFQTNKPLHTFAHPHLPLTSRNCIPYPHSFTENFAGDKS